MKKTNSLLKIILAPIIIMVVGYILLVAVRALPNSTIEKYVKRSADTLCKETDYPDIFVPESYVDNYTDADCISVVWNRQSNNVLLNGLDSFERFYGDVEERTQNLRLTVYDDNTSYTTQDHSYLWNGFQIWLKPALMRYDISDLRVAMTWCVIAHIMIIALEFYKRERKVIAMIPFLLSVLYFSFELEAMSILFFTDIVIALSACLYLLLQDDKKDKVPLSDNSVPYIAFTVFGALIAFLSMLIMPLLAFGYPMIIFLYCKKQESLFDTIKKMIGLAVCWLWGYASVLFTKVMLSKLIIASDSGSSQISKYIGGNMSDRVNRVISIFKRFINYGHLPKDILLIVILIFVVLIIMRKSYKRLIAMIPYAIICLCPIVWTFVMCGHGKHNWTVFNYSIAIFALTESLYLCSKKE